MLSIAESDDESSIMLVSDKPRAVIALSDARADALHAQLGLMLRTRKQRRGEPVRPEPVLDDVTSDADTVAAAPTRPGPILATRRQPFVDTVGREDAQSLIGTAEARDAAEVAARRASASPLAGAADSVRVANRKARLAKAGRAVEDDTGEGAEE